MSRKARRLLDYVDYGDPVLRLDHSLAARAVCPPPVAPA
jgi:hypothetical protein